MLRNANFIENKDNNKVIIDPNISIKLCDFGVAECFDVDNIQQYVVNDDAIQRQKWSPFLCHKQGLSIDNECYFAPEVFEGVPFDACCADTWCLGMILYYSLIGRPLYIATDVMQQTNGYHALHYNKLKTYLAHRHLLKYFTIDSFDLLQQLLCIDDRRRIHGANMLRHKWFTMYFNQYKQRIIKKFKKQRQELIKQRDKLKHFPFYHL